MTEPIKPITPIVSGDDYLLLPSAPSTWLLKGLVPSGGSCLLYGEAKVGKSFAAMQMALAIATNQSWLGYPTERAGKVVYLQLDTPRSIWQHDMRGLRANGIDTAPVYQADRETLPFPFDILSPEHTALLRAGLFELKPDVVVVDTIRMAHDLDENDSTTMKRVMSNLIAATMPSSLIIVAHARKGGFGGEHGPTNDVINDNRGSNYLVGAVDAICKFTKKTLLVKGRAVEEGSIRIRRLPNLFWELDEDNSTVQVESVLADPGYTTQADRIRELVVRLGISPEAAKKRLQRYLEG